MVSTKTFLARELDRLSEAQLQQVADFVAFIKFRDRRASWHYNYYYYYSSHN